MLSTYLFQKASGSLSITKPNLISIVYYYSFVVSSFIGTLLIGLDAVEFYMIKKISGENTVLIGFTIICAVMIIFPLTMVTLSRIIGFDANKEFHNYVDKNVNLKYNSNSFYLTILMFSAVSLLAVLYTILYTKSIPIFELLKGSDELGQLRIEASRNFGGIVIIRNIFAIALTPLLSLIAYVMASKTKQMKWTALFLVLLGASIFIMIYDLAKSPIFFYIIMLIILKFYLGELKLKFSKVLGYSIVGFAVLIGMYVVLSEGMAVEQYLSISTGPLGRIFFSQIAPTFLHIDKFGDNIPYLTLSSLPGTIMGIFDIEQIRSARVLMEYVFPERVEAGTAGVLNTLFVGEAYAAFGPIGVLLATIYVALFVQLIYIIFLKLPKNPVLISLFVYFSVNIPRTVVGGYADFLFNPIWLVITIYMVMILVANIVMEQLLKKLNLKVLRK
jgi:oligosaccharide repeat unit polymerase